MRIRFLEPAREELLEAVRFYEQDQTLVLAVAHQRRRPGYWEDRI